MTRSDHVTESYDQIQVLDEPQFCVKKAILGFNHVELVFKEPLRMSNLNVKGEVFSKGWTAKGTPQRMFKHDSHITNLK